MQSKNYRVWLFFTIGVYLSLSVGSICHGIIQRLPVYEITADTILSLLLGAIFERYVKQYQLKYNRRLQDKQLFVILFFIVNLIMAVGTQEQYGYVWLLPVAMISMCSGLELASALYLVLLLQNLLLHNDIFSARTFVVMALYGVICLWLWSQRISGKILPYLFAIMLSVDGIFLILSYRFLFPHLVAHRKMVLAELGSIIVLEVFICCYYLYRQHYGKETEEDRVRRWHLQKSLSAVLEADYGLLLRLQEYSGPLFMHSMRISSVSAQAARYMGGNAQLAQAGGLYHEIGRITNEKDYIRAGIELLQENDFPEELIAIIRQHSTGNEKPKTLEAAIVMLTDCIISTSDYLEKTGHRGEISDEKLVNSIFQNRLEKGNLDEAGLTEEQIESLRQFYRKQVFFTESDNGETEQ